MIKYCIVLFEGGAVFDLNGGVVGFRYNGARYYYEKNLMGDIIAIYNESSNKVGGYTYDAWGNCTITANINNVATANPFRYRGYYYDSDLGLYYLKSRYYDAQVGRFINADDISYLGANGDLGAYNLFAYCGDNPVAMIDTNGNEPTFWEIVIERAKNADGSLSLYDNDRSRNVNSWHEQILVIHPSMPNFGPEDGVLSISLGSISAGIYTGGWEYENLDLSLFDLGHAEAVCEISKNGINIGASASIWSPSVSFTIWGYTVELGVEVGAIGAKVTVGNGVGLKIAGLFGISFNVAPN